MARTTQRNKHDELLAVQPMRCARCCKSSDVMQTMQPRRGNPAGGHQRAPGDTYANPPNARRAREALAGGL
eukprot:3315495-Pyramimonas_sp.AAC.1